MTALTAFVLGPITFWPPADITLCLKALLASCPSESETSGSEDGLSKIRVECLLAYYEFHHLPGSAAWMRVSRLTRKAHGLGLNQIENPDLCSAFDADTTSHDTVEDWRLVWWCIYCLDSYSNISSGSPFVVDPESINTALPSRLVNGDLPVAPSDSQPQRIFLADDLNDLWETVQQIVKGHHAVDLNLHLVATTVLRRAGHLLRIRSEKGPGSVQARLDGLKRSLALLRLALPSRYFHPSRLVINGESKKQHHMRLTNLLLMHMAFLIVALPGDRAEDGAGWTDCLQSAFHPAQDIASVVENWNNNFNSQTDPAICLIIYAALQVLYLHRRSGIGSTPSSHTMQSENLLHLFLTQFGGIWSLPRKLAQLYCVARETDAGPLSSAEIDILLKRARTPLHPKFANSHLMVTEHPSSTTFPDLTLDFIDPVELLSFVL
ncbi:uncharacterized protein JN550_013093 [Neoarthrinium moseri]|uniref:uncharacterized protein n=1 Tax=Neoarthrinium moseri TaxID=1658444 RepID=UPI001FDDFE2D|nr:uncharacterized protein JN550_013093 [Neoarthrinium moseri]KAI1857757.1 hypothetical protein JN550_013093 [Neoarthrinium moseri]